MKAKEQTTQQRIEQLQGKEALLQTWLPRWGQESVANRAYIKALKARTRQVKHYVLNRRDPEALDHPR